MTPIYIRDRNFQHYALDGMIVSAKSVPTGGVRHHPRYADVSYEPVTYHLTPGAFVPASGKPFMVTVYRRMDRGYYIYHSTRYASFATAMKRLQQISKED